MFLTKRKCCLNVTPNHLVFLTPSALVDSRILKAVAIENSKDFFLTEPESSRATNFHDLAVDLVYSAPCSGFLYAAADEESNQLTRRKVLVGKRSCSSTEPSLETSEAPNMAAGSKFHENNNNEAADVDNSMLHANLETEEVNTGPQTLKMCFPGLPRTSSSNGAMVGEENSAGLVVPLYSPEQFPEGVRTDQHFESGYVIHSIHLRNKKKTMESIMNLMKEVELEEAAAEQAKEEAAKVYGEKAILVTEVKELENRLLSLSDERDKSLSILDEMRRTLKARQFAAQELMRAAVQEKLEKEESARNALAEQEPLWWGWLKSPRFKGRRRKKIPSYMSFLWTAVKLLTHCKYELVIGKIYDCYIYDGHASGVEVEISVICEDIRVLKQRFDERILFSKSISSSQTSCILASSGSSLKSATSDLGSGQWETAKTPKKRSLTPSVDGQSPKSRSSDERNKADGKELSDDGWGIFDRDAEF
ncbi:hypothetical protein F3Y22_tig00005459pilonHSYRG00352 [Hibiscus syriacus]|uniref:Uncharacterized protein n=1 Tax=Hibiscus syriacus TaxID=106335 RepID=A0A6A3CE65_HIBSY|nr:hypothetical protein F3Y22_tig00005459pilonHSYRG00352 [Hibiscus syriacus]